MDVNKHLATYIINTLSKGIPPMRGNNCLTVGLDSHMKVIEEEYLKYFIKEGGSIFKLVVSAYGGGKTHFLYCIRDLAWSNNYVVSLVNLSPSETPFHKLELVYKSIINNILSSDVYDEEEKGAQNIGFPNLLKSWYSKTLNEYPAEEYPQAKELMIKKISSVATIESISFRNAVKYMVKALGDNDEESFSEITQWLNGEGFDRNKLRKYSISEAINGRSSFKMIRSLAQVITSLEYAGLVILFDETEAKSSLSSKQNEQIVTNIREIIDFTTNPNFGNVFILYAVPDLVFLEGKANIYNALKQRLETNFDEYLNPQGIKINLEHLYVDKSEEDVKIFLKEIGLKINSIFCIAKEKKLSSTKVDEVIKIVSDYALERRFAASGFIRLFVQKMIQGLNFLSSTGKVPTIKELDKK